MGTLPTLGVGFCGGTDATVYQFRTEALSEAFSYSMQELIARDTAEKVTAQSKVVNPPFVYGLDSKVLSDGKAVIALALGNGTVALWTPTLDGGDEEKEDDEEEVDDPLCCHQMHASAVSDVSFGVGDDNSWVVSCGTDKFLMISEWSLASEDGALQMEPKFRIPLNEKPNSMVCTGNEIAQIVVADLSTSLEMYALKG